MGDRLASFALAKCDVLTALTHYEQKGAVRFSNDSAQSIQAITCHWQARIHAVADCKNNIMLTFTRAAVATLNQTARVQLQTKGILPAQDFIWQQLQGDGDEEKVRIPINLACGERLLLRENNKALGIHNGDMAIVKSINHPQLTARLDSGEQVTIPKSYLHIHYGYALTLHKAQGMSVNNVDVLIDSRYWDRNLSYVAMTRHRNTVTLFADKETHPNRATLHKTLSRAVTMDNVIDWPLDFAIRRGLNPDGLVMRFINKVAGVSNAIKAHFNYFIQHESQLVDEKKAPNLSEVKVPIKTQEMVADYRMQNELYNHMSATLNEDRFSPTTTSSHSKASPLFEQLLVKDKSAHQLITHCGNDLRANTYFGLNKQALEKAANRFVIYQALATIGQASELNDLPDTQNLAINTLNLKQESFFINQVSGHLKLDKYTLCAKVRLIQAAYQKKVLAELKVSHPIVQEFENTKALRTKQSGFKAELIDKQLKQISQGILDNSELTNTINHNLPKLAQCLADSLRNKALDLSL